MFRKVFKQRPELARSVEIDIGREICDDHASSRAAWQRIEQPFERPDREVSKGRISNRLTLGHLKIARQFVEKDQNRFVAKDRNPLIDTRCPGSVAPERRHHLAMAELLGNEPPQEMLRILVAIENDNVRDAELRASRYSWDHFGTQLRGSRQQPERN